MASNNDISCQVDQEIASGEDVPNRQLSPKSFRLLIEVSEKKFLPYFGIAKKTNDKN